MANTAPPVWSVLVATPTPAFGDLIRHSLEETGSYHVRVVYTAHEAQIVIATTCCQIAILDNDLSDCRLGQLAQDLHSGCPELKLVLIPPDNDPKHPALDGIPSAATLCKPFYLPELIDLMDQLAHSDAPDLNPASSLHHWITQPVLDQLLATTSASAGAVAARNGDFVLGGTLPDGAEPGLAALISRFWQREERTDLVRFARLEAAQGSFDCLIYLTALNAAEDTAAGLVYPIQTPLSKVRVQAAPLIHALHELLAQHAAQIDAVKAVDAPPAQLAPLEEKLPPPAAPNPTEWNDADIDQADFEAEFPSFNLAELLGAIPSPDPNGKTTQSVSGYSDWLPEVVFQSADTLDADTSPPFEETPSDHAALAEADAGADISAPTVASGVEEAPVQALDAAETPPPPASTPQEAFPSTPRIPDSDHPVTANPQSVPSADDILAVGAEQETPVSSAVAPPPLPASDALAIAMHNFQEDAEAAAAGEQGSVLTSLTSLDQLESATAGLSQLNYTCVLIPRLPQHYLTRELSEKVGQWIQQLCLAFGWRLEGIALRPEYLQWTVQVAPTISPGSIVKIVRLRTSEFIFEQFETLGKQNPSGDFWAAGYLIVSGSQPPSAGLLRDYIQQTRRRQGIIKNPGEAPPRLNS
jgi:REP element-mobilizing transposase RayT